MLNCVTFNEVVLAVTLMGAACGYFGYVIGKYARSDPRPEGAGDRLKRLT